LLTDREREIVRMLAEERSDKDIAHALRICIKTVETHRAAIMRALGTRLLADLVRYAIRNQLIVP
jgi:DNA-binding NarL/FixJ family response regulator